MSKTTEHRRDGVRPAFPKAVVGPIIGAAWVPIVYVLYVTLGRAVGQPTVSVPDPTAWYPYVPMITRHGEWAVPLVLGAAVLLSIPVAAACYTFLLGDTWRRFVRINQTFFLFGLFNLSGAFVALGGLGFIWGFPILGTMIIGGAIDDRAQAWMAGGIWLTSGAMVLAGILIREVKLRLAERWRIEAFFDRNPNSLLK